MDWLLIFLTSTGHVNGHVEEFMVYRYAEYQQCMAQRRELFDKFRRDEPRGICFPVAKIEKQ